MQKNMARMGLLKYYLHLRVHKFPVIFYHHTFLSVNIFHYTISLPALSTIPALFFISLDRPDIHKLLFPSYLWILLPCFHIHKSVPSSYSWILLPCFHIHKPVPSSYLWILLPCSNIHRSASLQICGYNHQNSSPPRLKPTQKHDEIATSLRSSQ